MKVVIVGIIIAILFGACQEERPSEGRKPLSESEKNAIDTNGVIQGQSLNQYVGKAGELVVVAENTIFLDEIATLLDTVFGELILPYYPPQPKFEIKHITPEKFEKGFHRIRNLLFLELVDDENQAPSCVIKKDYYANSQLVTVIKAPTMDGLVAELLKQAPELVEKYETIEWKREYYRHKKDNNTVLKSQLAKQFGITLELPKLARYESNKSGNYAHIIFPQRSRQMDLMTDGGAGGSKANFIQSGIMIWKIPYVKSDQFTPEYLMRARDTLLKYNALHDFPGVYMGTQDHPAVLPVHSYIKIGDVEGYEFRGLYKFTGRLEPSGGKFWSFHFIHPSRNEIIAVSGYLDAPPTMSAALDLRKIQAVIYSLKLVD